tara:strand:+ start:315 stop:602 length:288 start_codon:yes stop_codon:yes gene_type:complete
MFLNKKFMAFRDIFKDNNNINEKTIVGFLSFGMMAVFALTDIITGVLGDHLVIEEFIYNSFLIVTLGSFGIAEIGKVFSNKKSNNKNEEVSDEEL